MQRVLGIIAAIASILGFLLMISMFWASENNGGMAVLGLQVFGLIVSSTGIVLGGLAMFFARPEKTHGGEIGFGLGLGNILALIIAYLLF